MTVITMGIGEKEGQRKGREERCETAMGSRF